MEPEWAPFPPYPRPSAWPTSGCPSPAHPQPYTLFFPEQPWATCGHQVMHDPLCSEPSQDSYLTQVISPGPADFPNGPVVKTPCFHCKEHGFDPWLGNEDPAGHRPWPRGEKVQVLLTAHGTFLASSSQSPCCPPLLLSYPRSLGSCHLASSMFTKPTRHSAPQGLCTGRSMDLESSPCSFHTVSWQLLASLLPAPPPI